MSNSSANSLARALFPAAGGPSTTINFEFSSNRLVVGSSKARKKLYLFSLYGNGAGFLTGGNPWRITFPEIERCPTVITHCCCFLAMMTTLPHSFGEDTLLKKTILYRFKEANYSLPIWLNPASNQKKFNI
jgi:hypothetical protein